MKKMAMKITTDKNAIKTASKRILSKAMLAATASALAGGHLSLALAQQKPIKIVVAFTAGGPVDFVARTLAEQLSKEMGRSVIVENKPGANGAIGAVDVLKSEPDGTTLWITSVGAVAINPALYEKLPYDMQKDFAPVSLVVNNVELLVVNQKDPANSAAEFVANVKRRKDPTPMASSGSGSIPHLAIEQLSDSTGAALLHIPYKGAAPAITDLMGGTVNAFFGDVPGLITHVKGGRLKAIGIASEKRHPALPDVKTLEEQGIKGVDTINWYALFAPIKTPTATIDALNKAIRAAVAVPAVFDKLQQSGADPVTSTPQELASLLRRDTEKWAKMIKAKGIKPE
jgi:tripartite-type tricarboxylate transporter receptor subunit TctC